MSSRSSKKSRWFRTKQRESQPHTCIRLPHIGLGWLSKMPLYPHLGKSSQVSLATKKVGDPPRRIGENHHASAWVGVPKRRQAVAAIGGFRRHPLRCQNAGICWGAPDTQERPFLINKIFTKKDTVVPCPWWSNPFASLLRGIIGAASARVVSHKRTIHKNPHSNEL